MRWFFRDDRKDQRLAIVMPSCAISRVSMATSLASEFMSVAVILVGQALARVHTIVGLPLSSDRVMVMGTRCTLFNLISLNHFQS